ncbi:MAG: FAD binding domain-containing protein [Candidatus Hydrogenedentes bacterium]|nr:FAD binding domain-containing protein [Candidatus Hydrogenedentota bacterium]
MKKFVHIDATTVEDAVQALGRYGGEASPMAGGTDLLGKMKDVILPDYPEAIVNLKTINGLDFIEERDSFLRIGALTRLKDIAVHPAVRSGYLALADAAGRTASPNLREMATIGGNICQDIRCWYYRHPNNRFPCLRKGGGRCYAINGDNRYHSIFGGSVEQGCYAVHPSDTAPALIAMDARIKTSKRDIEAEDFFDVRVCGTTVLDSDEIVTEIYIPKPASGAKSAFLKFALRKTIDFPIVNCVAMIEGKGADVVSARICLNAVHVKPYRAVGAEDALLGRELSEATAKSAGIAAVADAQPMTDNEYMIQIAKTLVKTTVLACK